MPVTSDVWRPLGLEGETLPNYDALHEGVPAWMEESFWDWMQGRLTRSVRHTYDIYPEFNVPLIRQVERVCRVRVQYNDTTVSYGVRATRDALRKADRELVVADYLLAQNSNQQSQRELDLILHESGSKWKVGTRAGKPGLVQRVPEGVDVAANATMAEAGHAGHRLAEAWGTAFGMSPNPSHAYSLAVKAVEDAAIPLISPRDSSATLGKLISQMRNTGDWSLPLQREDQHATTSSTLIAMMKMLWAGQADRHGGHPDPDLVITQEAAEVAVMSAATLVQWFTSGAVARRK